MRRPCANPTATTPLRCRLSDNPTALPPHKQTRTRTSPKPTPSQRIPLPRPILLKETCLFTSTAVTSSTPPSILSLCVATPPPPRFKPRASPPTRLLGILAKPRCLPAKCLQCVRRQMCRRPQATLAPKKSRRSPRRNGLRSGKRRLHATIRRLKNYSRRKSFSSCTKTMSFACTMFRTSAPYTCTMA